MSHNQIESLSPKHSPIDYDFEVFEKKYQQIMNAETRERELGEYINKIGIYDAFRFFNRIKDKPANLWAIKEFYQLIPDNNAHKQHVQNWLAKLDPQHFKENHQGSDILPMDQNGFRSSPASTTEWTRPTDEGRKVGGRHHAPGDEFDDAPSTHNLERLHDN